MPRSKSSYPLLLLLVLLLASPKAGAQFRSEAFQQGYGDENAAPADSVEQMFSFKEFFSGVAHKQELQIGTLMGGSSVFVGAAQIYNRQYWKLPIIYGGLGATVGMGVHYRNEYKRSVEAGTENLDAKRMSNMMFAGAGLVYWGTIMDGVISFKTDIKPHPGKATLYSILVPGLGQAYNGEEWKIPIYWGCLLGAYHFYENNNVNYHRFKRIHNEATTPDSGYKERISAKTALYYRDVYRRYRDYSTVALAAFYLLQVIDANVFSYMQDFEVNDDLSMTISPTVITPDSQFASAATPTGFGLKFGFSF